MKEGTYNEDVNDNLNARQRTGTISRKDYWDIFPERKDSYLSDITAATTSEKRSRILLLLSEVGKSNREIADELFLSEGTVRNYISSILDKLSLRDRTQLAVFYLTKVRN